MSAVGYAGPQCPLCEVPLSIELLRTGVVECVACRRPFEATLFQPVDRRPQQVETLAVTPDGVANACANHARNAAVTSCQRCGLFICSLCDMNVGEGSFCPTCFDRVRAEGGLKSASMRYRDFAGTARAIAVVGLFMSFAFMGIAFGPLAIYYAIKGIRQRREEGRSALGMIVVIFFGILECLSTLGLIAVMAWG